MTLTAPPVSVKSKAGKTLKVAGTAVENLPAVIVKFPPSVDADVAEAETWKCRASMSTCSFVSERAPDRTADRVDCEIPTLRARLA